MNVARVCSSHPLKWPGHLVARAEYEEHAGANLFSKAGLEEGIFFFPPFCFWFLLVKHRLFSLQKCWDFTHLPS